MQCHRIIWRNACYRRNAYDVTSALRATFCATATSWHFGSSSPEQLISLWELGQAGKYDNLVPKGRARTKASKKLGKAREPKDQVSIYDEAAAHAIRVHEELVQELASSVDTGQYGQSTQDGLVDVWKNRILEVNAAVAQFLEDKGTSKWSESDMSRVLKDTYYRGTVIAPASSPLNEPLPFPWALHRPPEPPPGQTLDPIRDVLEPEIERFAAYARPTPAEQAARQHVAREVHRLVRSIDPEPGGYHVESTAFGSEVTGLALATSDLDFRIYSPQFERNIFARTRKGVPIQRLYRSQNILNSAMSRIYHRMLRPDSGYTDVYLRGKTYPLISARHALSGLDVQIVGTEPKLTQQGAILRFLREYPDLQSIYTVIRASLGSRGLLDTFYGGLGSYGTLIMVLFAMARRNAAHARPLSFSSSSSSSSPSASPSPSPGEYLLHVLATYADLNPTTHGLTLTPGPKFFPRRTHDWHQFIGPTRGEDRVRAGATRHDPTRAGQWRMARIRPVQPYLLVLQDPADAWNNLGARGTAIKHVLFTMKVMLWELGERMDGIRRGVYWSRRERWGHKSLLEGLVGRYHEVNLERRAKLEGFGRRVLEGEFGVEDDRGIGEGGGVRSRGSEGEGITEARTTEQGN